MVFLGTTFNAMPDTFDSTLIVATNLTTVRIGSARFDDLYISRDPNTQLPLPQDGEWDEFTVLWAHFQNTLFAGTLLYDINHISHFLIKRKKVTQDGVLHGWVSLFRIPVFSVDDIVFERVDMYNACNAVYDYAVVPVINGAEVREGFAVKRVTSNFDGLFIVGEDAGSDGNIVMYASKTDYAAPRRRRIGAGSVVKTLGRKRPFVIHQGATSYDEMSIEGMFVPFDCDACALLIKEGYRYRDRLMDFLVGGSPKIVKIDDGRIVLADVISEPEETQEPQTEKFVTSFEIAEVGDAENATDLFNANLIDVDPRQVLS